MIVVVVVWIPCCFTDWPTCTFLTMALPLDNVCEALQMCLVLHNELSQSPESLTHHQVQVFKRRVNEMVSLLNDYCTVLNLPHHISDEMEIISVDLLEQYKIVSHKCSSRPPGAYVCPKGSTGEPGRPSFILDQSQVEGLRAIGMSWEDIAKLLGISSRTLRRKRQTFVDFIDFEYSEIINEDLDNMLRQILEQSPNSGERMIIGALRSQTINFKFCM